VNATGSAMDCMRKEGSPGKPGSPYPSTGGAPARRPSDRGAADCLSLAAAPTFALMALLTAVLGGGPLDMLCGAASPLTGMVPMYLLMSAFHAGPWLRLLAGRA
jgi:hypothetical protein